LTFRNLRLALLAGLLAIGITLAALASLAARAHAAPKAQLTVYAAADECVSQNRFVAPLLL
jgi:hypothetical protein